MKNITLDDIKVPIMLDIVHELKDQGWVQGQDFDFTYHPARHRTDTLESYIVHMPSAVFTFYTEKYATYFVLKYGDHIK
jgi:hypothetical protein